MRTGIVRGTNERAADKSNSSSSTLSWFPSKREPEWRSNNHHVDKSTHGVRHSPKVKLRHPGAARTDGRSIVEQVLGQKIKVEVSLPLVLSLIHI